jgi:hypothetical protein
MSNIRTHPSNDAYRKGWEIIFTIPGTGESKMSDEYEEMIAKRDELRSKRDALVTDMDALLDTNSNMNLIQDLEDDILDVEFEIETLEDKILNYSEED